MRYLLIILSLFLYSCEDPEPEEEIYGCCDEEAFNYNEDTTIHTDSLCIYYFEFLSPLETDIWEMNSSEIIEWTGGDSELNLYISLNDADASAHEITISESTLNTGSYEWVVETDEFGTGNKRIYIAQDLNSDGIIDSSNDIYGYSDDFIIIEEILEGFEFISPSDGYEWVAGEEQTIEWTGGTDLLNIRLSLVDVNTNTGQGTIVSELQNTDSYLWTVDCFACIEGPKTIYIEQDTDGDGNIDLWAYSEQFTIISE